VNKAEPTSSSVALQPQLPPIKRPGILNQMDSSSQLSLESKANAKKNSKVAFDETSECTKDVNTIRKI